MRKLQAQVAIGDMNELVRFKTPSSFEDEFGGTTYDVGGSFGTPYRAAVTYIRNQEQMSAAPQDKVFTEIKIVMRKLSQMPEYTDLVSWNDKVFEIVGVSTMNGHRFIIIQAREILNTNPA